MSICQFRIEDEKKNKLRRYCEIRGITITKLLIDYVEDVLDKPLCPRFNDEGEVIEEL